MLATLPSMMSVAQTAEALDVGISTVHRWIKRGKLRAVILPSGRKKIYREDVETILVGTDVEAAS